MKAELKVTLDYRGPAAPLSLVNRLTVFFYGLKNALLALFDLDETLHGQKT